MKPILQTAKEHWQPQPVPTPVVDAEFTKMDGLQRATESWRYVLLRCEFWVSPSGDIREWLRHNTRLGAWLLIPAVVVMPVIGLILWQVSGWLSMLTTIAGKLIVLSILILLALAVFRIVAAFFRR